jgi:hypothetical protein
MPAFVHGTIGYVYTTTGGKSDHFEQINGLKIGKYAVPKVVFALY